MRRHIGLIIGVAVIVVMGLFFFGSKLFGEKAPLPTFEPLPSIPPTESASLEAPATIENSKYIVEFHAGTTTTELAPKLPDLLLPDFTDMEEASPISFGKHNLGGRRVIAYSAEEYVETYLTYVNGGVWSITMRCAYADKDSERAEFKAYLDEWVYPKLPDQN